MAEPIYAIDPNTGITWTVTETGQPIAPVTTQPPPTAEPSQPEQPQAPPPTEMPLPMAQGKPAPTTLPPSTTTTTPISNIPPPPKPLATTALMEYQVQYAREHNLPPPEFTQEQKEIFAKERGYTSPEFIGADITKEPEKFTPAVRALTGVELPKVIVAKPEDIGQLTLKVGIKSDNPEQIILTKGISDLRDSPIPQERNLYNILLNEGIDNYNRAIAASQFEYQQFTLRNTKLPDGQYISNIDLAKVKEENPELYNIYITKGFDSANQYIASTNARNAGIASRNLQGLSLEEIAARASIGQLTQAQYDSLTAKAAPFTTIDGKIRVYDALVAGAMTQDEIRQLTGSEVNTKIPVPFTEFGDSYIKSHPILASDGKTILAGGSTDVLGLQGVGLLNYPEWYKKAVEAYDKLYGFGEGGKALLREQLGETSGAFVGAVPSKLIEPTQGIHATNAGDWVNLGIGVASLATPLWLPKVVELAPRLNPLGEVKLPLASGEDVTVWKGIKAGSQPLLGVSEGQITVGTKGIKLPLATELKLPGAEGAPFEPRTGLETKVIGSRSAMEKMGFPEEAITTVERTLPEVKSFDGRPSPYLNKQLVTESTDTLSPQGVEAVLKQGVVDSDIVQSVKNYGSYSMRPQLSPEALDEWVNTYGRYPADIDVQLGKVGQEGASNFAKRLVERINQSGVDNVSIDPENPTLIIGKSRSTGATRHAVDIHYEGEPSTTPTSEQFNSQVYGFKKEAPLVEVDIPNVGKVKLAGLAETGIGKTEQVLGWRIDPDTGLVKVGTEAHRVKDYIDLYEIIKTYGGAEKADAWAREIGLDLDSLNKLGNQAKSDIGWEFTPSKGADINSIPTSKTSISVIGDSLRSAASSIPIGVTSEGNLVTVSSEPSSQSDILYRRDIVSRSVPSVDISAGISPILSLQSTPSVIEVSQVSPETTTEGDRARSIAEEIRKVKSPRAIIASPKAISTIAPVEPISPTIPSIPSFKSPAFPYEAISPKIPSVSKPLSIGQLPTTPISPPISPIEPLYPTIEKQEEPKPPLLLVKPKSPSFPGKKQYEPGTIVWIQGRPQYRGQGHAPMFKVLEPPYDKLVTTRDIPDGYKDEGYTGKGSAFKSIQILGGTPLKDIENLDLGFARVNILIEGGQPRVEYVQDADSNVGSRGMTVGMGKGQIPIEEWETAKAQGVSFEEFKKSYTGHKEGEPHPQGVSNETKVEPKAQESQVTTETQETNVTPKEETSETTTEKIVESRPTSLNAVELTEYRTPKTIVKVVDGDYVRNTYDVDFVLGGNWKRYAFIPKYEYWIESGLNAEDTQATVLHELAEVPAMGSGRGAGKAYEYGHDKVAAPLEREGRAHPEKIESMIQSILDKYRPKTEVVEPEVTKPEKQTNWWESEVYQEPKPKQVYIPEPTYRGRSIIQPDLGMVL